MRLPLLVSVPHAGRRVPPEAEPFCILSEEELWEDGDGGADEIYALAEDAAAFLTTDIARAVVDLNRAEDDRRPDGVVKTHTCWNVPVYHPFPPEDVVETLLARYYRPYHQRLTVLARSGVKLGVDCHTMAAQGPPVGPDPGAERPRVCLSNADVSCPRDWMESLRECFQSEFGADVRVNDAFRGGFITRSHSAEIPWVQIELSRGPFFTNDEKRDKVLAVLSEWCRLSA
ncbi:MAG TPA: N-formylglutamate amidohydrolase [Vicinamibacteria bacterium]|jgi:N-formylglutamate amidohydrolase